MNMLRGFTRRIVCSSLSAGQTPFAFQARQKHYANVTAKVRDEIGYHNV